LVNLVAGVADTSFKLEVDGVEVLKNDGALALTIQNLSSINDVVVMIAVIWSQNTVSINFLIVINNLFSTN
jgi:hypothetical protein